MTNWPARAKASGKCFHTSHMGGYTHMPANLPASVAVHKTRFSSVLRNKYDWDLWGKVYLIYVIIEW